mmetsp:Transcript_9545/g.28182  ORF Transcript_9545/g.28182 Transcript_9545/m.28182 type:complete len:82 (+) Transcript_9545:186-431(+)
MKAQEPCLWRESQAPRKLSVKDQAALGVAGKDNELGSLNTKRPVGVAEASVGEPVLLYVRLSLRVFSAFFFFFPALAPYIS